jgi:NhaP-type Na+/H+ or K+/H+ antiporter
MNSRTWIYNSSLLAGLIFIVLGVRLYFRNDIKGLLVHFVLALILFVAALLTGRGGKDKNGKDDL